MNENITNQKGIIAQIVMILILAIGLVVAIYLVQHQTIFRPKADEASPVIQGLEIKDANGNVVKCDGSTNPPTCETTTQDVTIRVKDLVPFTKLGI